MSILIDNNDLFYMDKSLELAQKAAIKGEVPVGAVLVIGNRIISMSHNECEQKKDPTLHAEIIVIRDACQKQTFQRLEDSTLYVTLEPCPMCMGAIVNARIKRLVFGAYDEKKGACGSVVDLSCVSSFGHSVDVVGGVLEKKSSDLISEFFKKIRKK